MAIATNDGERLSASNTQPEAGFGSGGPRHAVPATLTLWARGLLQVQQLPGGLKLYFLRLSNAF